MSDTKTLHEVCNALGVSRRAVQGYEEIGLVTASGRNKYGYLLYDEEAQKRIEQIKLYQQLGFKRKEIKEFIDAPSQVIKSMLEKQVLHLKDEHVRLDVAIKKAYELIEIL